MAPKKCGGCSEGIYGKQQRINCGGCSSVFHLLCAKVNETDLEYLMDDGKSKYKCDSCSRIRINDGTPVSGDRRAGSRIPKNSQVVERKNLPLEKEDNAEIDDLTEAETDVKIERITEIVAKFDMKIDSLMEIICELKDEIVLLKGENTKLCLIINEIKQTKVDDVQVLTDSVPECVLVPGSPSKMAWTEVVKGKGRRNRKKKPNDGSGVESAQLRPAVNVQSTSASERDFQPDGKLRSGNSFGSASRRNAQRIVGERTSKDAVVKARRRALFTSRFLPDMTENDLEKFLRENSTLESLKCIKMKSKFPEKYSSFHVSVEESEYGELIKPSNWPKGALVLPFFGKLRDPDVGMSKGNEVLNSNELTEESRVNSNNGAKN